MGVIQASSPDWASGADERANGILQREKSLFSMQDQRWDPVQDGDPLVQYLAPRRTVPCREGRPRQTVLEHLV